MKANPVEVIRDVLDAGPGVWGSPTLPGEIVAALDAAGYVIVPKEPTPEMMAGASAALDKSDRKGFTPAEWYAAMIEARPK